MNDWRRFSVQIYILHLIGIKQAAEKHLFSNEKTFETKGLSSTCFNLLLTQSHSKYCQNEDLFIIYDMSHVRNTSSSSHKYQSRIRVEWNRMGLEGWSRGKNKLFLCNGRIFNLSTYHDVCKLTLPISIISGFRREWWYGIRWGGYWRGGKLW